MRVLFVCTGNICRSPMAEGLLRLHLRRAGCEDVEVASAGTWAGSGLEVTELVADTMAARGVDISAHRSRPLTAEELRGADLVVAMTSVQVREITELLPEAASRTLLIKALPEMSPAGSRGLDALLAAKRPPWRRALDVDDPIGLPITAYERCAKDLEAGVSILAEALCSSAAIAERESRAKSGSPADAENEP